MADTSLGAAMSSSGAAGDRKHLIDDAVAFLTDPKVASSPLNQKIQFLESKGLGSQDIEAALVQASQSRGNSSSHAAEIAFPEPEQSSSFHVARSSPPPLPLRSYQDAGDYRYAQSHGYGPYGAQQAMMMRPEPPKRDWRDFFIMAVISGGVMYGVVSLARKYLLPHLQPPTTTSFQQTSAELAEQFDEASKLLAELQSQTSELQGSVEKEREKVDAVVEEVGEAVQKVKEGEERWREEMRELREEVQELRDLVPKMIEKHAREQTGSLSELQNDLKSLKTLLLARRVASDSSRSPAASPTATSSQQNGSSAQSDVSAAANALLAPRNGSGLPSFAVGGKPTIPAWQLAGSSSQSGGESGASSGSEVVDGQKGKEATVE